MHKELLWSLYRNHCLKNIVCTVSFIYCNRTPWGVALEPLPVTHGVFLLLDGIHVLPEMLLQKRRAVIVSMLLWTF